MKKSHDAPNPRSWAKELTRESGSKCKSFVSEERTDRIGRRKIAVIRNKALEAKKSRYVEDRE
jgi:hypothetical protein